MTKTRLLHTAYTITGLICLAVVLAAQIPPVAKRLVPTRKGIDIDLYDTAKAAQFRLDSYEPFLPASIPGLPVVVDSPKSEDITNSEIIFVGDSFFGVTFDRLFEMHTGHKSSLIRHPRGGFIGLEQFEGRGLKPGGELRYVVIESVDRFMTNILSANAAQEELATSELLQKALRKFRSNLEYFVTQNRLVYPLIELRCTFRFAAFKELTRNIPVYVQSPPILFLSEAVEFNRDAKGDDTIMLVADQLERYGRVLRERYGAELIVMPLPSKYTVYGYRYDTYQYNTPPESYDNFLPRLYEELDRRGIPYVDVYSDLMATDEMLYHPTGTHWNSKCMAIAIRKLNRLVSELSGLSDGRRRPDGVR